MKQELLRELAITGGIYDCLCDPYDKLKNGDPYSSVMVDLDRFAEKIIKECMSIADECRRDEWFDVSGAIGERFGVRG